MLSLESHRAAWQMQGTLVPGALCVPGAICSCQEAGFGDTADTGWAAAAGMARCAVCTELIDTKLYRPTCRDTDASRSSII